MGFQKVERESVVVDFLVEESVVVEFLVVVECLDFLLVECLDFLVVVECLDFLVVVEFLVLERKNLDQTVQFQIELWQVLVDDVLGLDFD